MTDLRAALEEAARRHEDITRRLAEGAGDPERWRELGQEHARLERVLARAEEYRRALAEAEAVRQLAAEAGPEEAGWLQEELAAAEERRRRLEQELRQLLAPRDPRDERDVILEIRAGTGGEEAALFAGDLLRMYLRYAERRGWRTEVLSSAETELGGFKEVIVSVRGEGVYSRLKHESGVHRVQRVPVTEAAGRIHTSTATVAVLPAAEEVDVAIAPEDLEVETFRASGAGGQYVNKTESAVRITHRPTGIVVTCQDERSQHKNRLRALQVLRARLYQLAMEQRQGELAAARRAQVGTGERAEKIRTYNFPQNRVTDHRLGLTLHRLDAVLDGDLDELLDALAARETAAALAGERS